MKRKWLLLGVYKPPIQSDSEFAEEIIRILNHYVPSYENNLNAPIKTPTCYQSRNPTCIDNI